MPPITWREIPEETTDSVVPLLLEGVLSTEPIVSETELSEDLETDNQVDVVAVAGTVVPDDDQVGHVVGVAVTVVWYRVSKILPKSSYNRRFDDSDLRRNDDAECQRQDKHCVLTYSLQSSFHLLQSTHSLH